MPPQGVDMQVIREALQRRMGATGGGAPPATAQMSAPNAALPTGGPNVGAPMPPPLPNINPGQLPSQSAGQQMPASSATPPQAAARTVGQATGFPDPEARGMAKTLLSKLVQFL